MDKAHQSLDCVQPAATFPRPACWQGFGQGLAVAEAVAPGTDLVLGLGVGEDAARLLPAGIIVRYAFVRTPGPTPVKQVSARSDLRLFSCADPRDTPHGRSEGIMLDQNPRTAPGNPDIS